MKKYLAGMGLVLALFGMAACGNEMPPPVAEKAAEPAAVETNTAQAGLRSRQRGATVMRWETSSTGRRAAASSFSTCRTASSSSSSDRNHNRSIDPIKKGHLPFWQGVPFACFQ